MEEQERELQQARVAFEDSKKREVDAGKRLKDLKGQEEKLRKQREVRRYHMYIWFLKHVWSRPYFLAHDMYGTYPIAGCLVSISTHLPMFPSAAGQAQVARDCAGQGQACA